MGLPAYLLEQPKTNPVTVVARQIHSLGFDVGLTRAGNTLTISNFDALDQEEASAIRAMRLLTDFADANSMSTDAIVYPIHGNSIAHYLKAGFQIYVDHDDDVDDGGYALLRRPVRS